MMDAKERELALRKMDEAINRFYTAAVNIGNHPFIEFAGLMTAYAKSCRRAHEADIDFTECNRHAGSHLPMEGFEVTYLAEKLGCIFGGRIEAVDEWRDAATAPRDGRQFLLLPSPQSKVWISAWWDKGRFYETAKGVPLRLQEGAKWRDSPPLPVASEAGDSCCASKDADEAWPDEDRSLVHEFRIQGLQGGEWQSVGWSDDKHKDLGRCESFEVAEGRLQELLETLVSQEVVRIGGHGWKQLRIVEVVETKVVRVRLVKDEVLNPGLDAARARSATDTGAGARKRSSTTTEVKGE